ncbi:MAG: MptD family putative ECF transporter S component [Pseudobutyrivibrio sp.]|uniref:MptD family putative ECF transporter S component n=1 Tax=Pseudobutyrivibrio sp. TaxID=2014367 RepID=UPI0025E46B92|nr:MptD family putative ECF transporter S component [Pseudobutyrivibrio sp.]MBQ8490013.1 MptD family putative ECF transporter S component [Pseudobutyrivibrio sp.]
MGESKNGITVKDCINIGVFAAIYIVVFFITSFVGYIPVLMVILGILCSITTGIPLMLFFSKSHTFGMITAFSVILGLFMVLMGRPWYSILIALVTGLASDYIMQIGKYKSINKAVVSSGVFSLWMIGMTLPMFFGDREAYFESIREGYGDAFVDVLYRLTPNWMFYVMTVLTFIGGILGGLLGRAVLKKHFMKAGMV